MDSSKGKALTVPCNGNFFRWWLEILKPLHRLTNREEDLAAAFLEKRYELSKSISDDKLLNEVLFSDACKKEVAAKVNITKDYCWTIMCTLKKRGFIKDGAINPRYIPPYKDGDKQVYIVYLFDIK